MKSDIEKAVARQKKLWNELAKEDAMRYIDAAATGQAREDFFAQGKKTVQRLCLPFFQREGFDPTGKRMLDLGCGVGRMTRFFSEIFGEAHGTDISEEMINLARNWNQGRHNLHFDVGNGVDLSIYEDNWFHFVFSNAVLYYLHKKEILLSYIHEVDRVLKAGGYFQLSVTGEWTRAFGIIPVHRLLTNWLVKTGLVDWYYRFARRFGRPAPIGIIVSRSELDDMLHGTSLEIIEMANESGYMWCKGRKR
jgi:ubiquinone/menaquinone biosynthesis C-methylase UbiE